VIGWYVHHHGRGHAHRAASVAAALSGVEVTGLSSGPAPAGWTGPWVDLPPDTDPGPDPTAGGVLHWAPLTPGYRDRAAVLAAWVAAARPEVVVVDASVEVTLLLRLLGVPVVVVAAPGDRLDRPHRAALDAAGALLAPWPSWVQPVGWPAAWRAKTVTTGAFSRSDHRSRPDVVARTVTVLLGAGGDDVTDEQLDTARGATPGWTWTVLGRTGWVADPWPVLASAQVVVTHAGQNALAEVAAARRPAVVLPQVRPHDEQATTGRALADADLAEVRTSWPTDWPTLLERTATRDGDRWARWNDGRGAQRAAALVREVLASCAPR
jgi:hypothetical protein